MAEVQTETRETLSGLAASGDHWTCSRRPSDCEEINRAGAAWTSMFALIKIAVLIALDAPPASYAWTDRQRA